MSRWLQRGRILLSVPLCLLLLSAVAIAQDLQGLKDAAEDHYAADRYAEAEANAKRLLPLLERQYGGAHEAVMEVMDRLAWSLYRQKRFEEAAQLHRRVIEARRKALGDRHALVARSIDGLARALWDLGRKDESKALSKQGIAALPPGFNLPGVAESVQRDAAAERRAADLASRGRLKEAEEIYRQTTDTQPAMVMPSEEALADTLLRQGRDREALEVHQRMIRVWQAEEKRYGIRALAGNLTRLARQYQGYGKIDKESWLLEMAAAAREETLGARHPETLADLGDLGRSYERQGRIRDAFRIFQRVADAERIRLAASAPDRMVAQSSSLRASVFGSLIRAAYALAAEDATQSRTLSRQAFEAAQWATLSTAGAALTQMSARFAAGSGPLAGLVRQLQDRQQEWQGLDRQLIDALAAPSTSEAEALLAGLRTRLACAEKTMADLGARILKDYPRYAELSSPQPLALDAVRSLLPADEALYFVFSSQDDTYAWIVTSGSSHWIRIPMDAATLGARVRDLRCGLDRDGEWEWSEPRKRWIARKPHCAKPRPDGLAGDELPPFDLALAHDLYRTLFGQVADRIKGKSLIVVASGPLATLPFQVLVTVPPGRGPSRDADALRRASWLGKTTAITVLPSVASLGSARTAVTDGAARRPYLGLGNPLIAGATGADKRAWARQACAPQVALLPGTISRASLRTAYANFFRGGLANVEALRRQVPLPETADELCTIAKALGASEEDVHLGARATERALKELSAQRRLRSYRVLHFATHGLLASETADIARGSAEPALMLTPPDAASASDDGLLTASEIAQLDMDAEWVVLSACNTAAGEKSNAEALSGFSRAFFYAGARSLLASHWYVDSYAAVSLTTAAFAELAANPALPHAEALRRAIVSFMAADPLVSHPALWAPFSVIGRRSGS
jgi:CHAT domain-containing protein